MTAFGAEWEQRCWPILAAEATDQAEERGYRKAIDRLRDGEACFRWLGHEEQAGRFDGYRLGLIAYLESTTEGETR